MQFQVSKAELFHCRKILFVEETFISTEYFDCVLEDAAP